MTKEAANWSPYDNNGGTVVAIAGADYCVIAGDTRMSSGYNILTREYSKINQLADKALLASSGFQADVRTLQKLLRARHLLFQHQHNKQMTCPAVAQLLSNTLYYKRFFPYYTHNVLGGLDDQGCCTPLSESEAIDLVKTCFASATERDIYTGDKVEIVILNASGTRREHMELRKD